ncbi:alpha-amylase family glycosyl hydrolase [Acholeplasma granularum]|uniref:alpha-amylase family glycosyl hydrolase n=1 Tax=Acholeplasma granularum TaxID=264635 RepID=UPI00047245E8|nr:alpha-amylase family glycosyl hydrolase [Acholeplasma granularum]
MAKNTSHTLKNKFIYQVFTRQHSKSQDFQGIIDDLNRIKSMGVDIIYLLPFHPIGKKDRKGEIGSPYAIYDYYAIDPLHGTLDDFKRLVTEVHSRGMKLMIDIVFNHTSRDSILTQIHPEWFYKKSDGTFANRIGDWSDITDFNLTAHPEIWTYLIDVLKYWAQYVDGYRCDVAPLLPLEFWKQARQELDKYRPDLIWLTESVEYGFIKYLRDMGYDASTDSQMYETFDICYDYDIFSFMDGYLSGKNSLERYLYELWRQEVTYPKNYVKLRAFENHDQERIANKVNNPTKLIQMTALQFFLKGTPMIYAGQEHQVSVRPSLFENDLVPWNEKLSIENLIRKLSKIKKLDIMSKGIYDFINTKNIAHLQYKFGNELLIGIFNLENQTHTSIDLPNGKYLNVLSNQLYEVKDGMIELSDEPIIIHIQ